MVANLSAMRRFGLIAAGALFAVSACGGGSKGDSASTSSSSAPASSSSSTPTTVTTTTVKPEDEVKAAYLAYWAAVDRVFAAPNPDDPELAQRAVDPLLASVKDQLSTKAAVGHRYVVGGGRPNEHRVSSVEIGSAAATVSDCWIDGTTEVDASGAVVDEAISTRQYRATLLGSRGNWRVSNIETVAVTEGVSGCAA